jgi:WD40 repeat protein
MTAPPRVHDGRVATLASGDTQLAGALSSAAIAATAVSGDGPAAVPRAAADLPQIPAETYITGDEIGRGGLGRILRAVDTRTGRTVAIKEMRVDSPDAATRFVREALVTANLQHPAIVPVYEVGRWPSGQPFYAMKLVSGGPLAASIDAAPSLADRTALLPHVIAVADALAYAHGEGIIHRDLKPANVMVGAHGETVVIDWGLARRVDQPGDIDTLPPIASAAPGETVVGAVLGTPVYMAPEQARGERVDARADVYAIGAMLYHLLAGRPPYGHLGTAAEVLAAVKAGPAPPLTAIAPAAPRELAAIVRRAMAHDAGARYPTAAALADDLRRFATGQLVSAHHYGRGERLRRFARRNRGALAIAAAAAVALGVTGALSIRRVVHEREAAQAAERGERAARTLAEDRGRQAQHSLARAHLQRASAEVAGRQPGRALPLLAAALDLGDTSDAARLLAATAIAATPALRAAERGAVAAMLPVDRDFVLATADHVERWSPDGAPPRWTTPLSAVSQLIELDAERLIAVTATGAVVLTSADGRVASRLGELPPGGPDGPAGADLQGTRWLTLKASSGLVELWDLATGQRVLQIPTPLRRGYAVASPDGRRLLVTGQGPAGAAATLYDVGSRRAIATPCDARWPCAIVPPATTADALVVARDNTEPAGQVRILDWDGRQRATLDAPAAVSDVKVIAEAGLVLAFANDGSLAAAGLADGVARWRARLPAQGYGLTLDTTGGGLFAFGRDGAVAQLDLATGTELRWWWLREPPVYLAVAAAHVAILDEAAALWTFPLPPADAAMLRPGPARVRRLAWLDAATLAATSDDGAVTLHDATSGAVRTRLAGHHARATTVERLPDGRVLTAGRDDRVIVWDAATGAAVRTLTGAGVRAAASPDGTRIATSDDSGRIAVYGASDTPVEIGRLTRPTMTVRWSPDGRWLAAIDESGGAGVWRTDDWTRVRDLPPREPNRAGGTDVVFAPDGRRVLFARYGAAALLALDGGADIAMAATEERLIWAVAYSPDGRLVATSNDAGEVAVWATATGDAVLRLPLGAMVLQVQFTADSRRVITGAFDHQVTVWDVATGLPLASHQVPDEIYWLTASPDGASVAIATLGAAMRWTPPPPVDAAAVRTASRCRAGHGLRELNVVPEPTLPPGCP